MPGLGAAPRLTRVRDRRRRGQGQPGRAPAAARVGRARAEMGDRLEVPTDHRGDEAQPDHLGAGQVRRPAPRGDARAGARGWRDREDGHAAQRGGSRAQGHPRGRGRDRPARRRCDPPGPQPRPARGRTQRSPAAAEPTAGVPDLPHPHGQARGLGVHAVPEPRLPRPALAAAQALRRRDGHRRAGGEAGRAVHEPRLGPHGGRLLPPHARADRRAARVRAGLGRQARQGDRGLEAPAVRARPVWPRDRGGRLRDRPQPRAALPHDRRAPASRPGRDRGGSGRRSQDGGQDPRAAPRRADA